MAIFVFAASVLFVLYVVGGYPMLLALLARIPGRARPFLKQFSERRVTILLPVRNGDRWLRRKLESILELNYPRDLLQIIVISDGSTDQSEAIAEEFAPRGVQLIRIRRSGKAAALNVGLRTAEGEILFFTDVRQELDPAALHELVACFGDPAVGVASGELFIRDGTSPEEADVGLYWRYEKWIRTRLSRLDSVLGATGCIYAMRRELAVEIPEDSLLDDMHLPLAAFFRGYRVILDGGAKAFDQPMSLQTEFRRKVRTLAGNYQILRQFPALLGPSNRMWFHFASHKLGRLLLPFALMAIAVSSVGLPGFWARLALGSQGLFYALAAIDPLIPAPWLLKRFTSPIRTFVVFMAAALAAVSYFFVPASRFWKETEPARAAGS